MGRPLRDLGCEVPDWYDQWLQAGIQRGYDEGEADRARRADEQPAHDQKVALAAVRAGRTQ